MSRLFEPGRRARVTKAYQRAYPNPLTFAAGEQLTLGRHDDEFPGWVWCVNAAGVEGWAPERYVEEHGTLGLARQDYTAIELTVAQGDELLLEQEESGWYWATTSTGERGWVPVSHVELDA